MDGSIEKFKARFVVQGFTSVPVIHHTETFARTPEMSTARLLVAVAAVQDWEVEQMDVSAAFLYAPLEEEIYVTPPPGYEDDTGRVWHLRTTLYGVKQAPRQWNAKLISVLLEAGFTQSPLDPSFFCL